MVQNATRIDNSRATSGTAVQPPDSAYWERSPSEPTEADMAVIMQLEQQDAEREKEKKKQMEEEDRKVAMQEQQKEHAAWEAQRNAEREARTRQIEADRLTAELTVSYYRDPPETLGSSPRYYRSRCSKNGSELRGNNERLSSLKKQERNRWPKKDGRNDSNGRIAVR
jgi:hypothetical protein